MYLSRGAVTVQMMPILFVGVGTHALTTSDQHVFINLQIV